MENNTISPKNPKTDKRTGRFGQRQKQRSIFRMLLYLATTVAFVVAIAFTLISYFSATKVTKANALGDYRSAASGLWGAVGTWEYYNGATWVPAVVVPSSADGVIDIRSGHTVTVNSNFTVDQVVISAGGTLHINAGTLTIANGSGTDIVATGTFDVTGTLVMNSNATATVGGNTTLKNSGTLTMNSGSTVTINFPGIFTREGGTMPTSSGYFIVNNRGKFVHAMDGGTLPSAAWNIGAIIEVSGIKTTKPNSLNQTFHHFIWNSTGQTASLDFAGSMTWVNGDFNVYSTGSGDMFFDSQGNNNTFNIGGNYIQTGGTTYVCINGASTINITGNWNISGGVFNYNKAGGTSYGNVSATINLTGGLNVTGGTLDMTQCTHSNSSKGNGILNIKGNLTVSGSGLITQTSTFSRGQINFNGTTTQNFTSNGNITNKIDYTVLSGATLNMSTFTTTGSGDFTLSAGAALISSHSGGISQSGSTGSIQNSGTRSFSTGADYTFNATSAQVTGSGLPTQVRNLTVNNSAGVQLNGSVTVSNTLSLLAGVVDTQSETLILGTSTSTLGTLVRTSGHIAGNFRRWLASGTSGNVLFPVGTTSTYNGANFNFTASPSSGGSILATYVNSNPGSNGIPLTDGGVYIGNLAVSYWTFTAMNSFAGGTYDVSLNCNGFNNVNDYTKLHILQRTNSGSAWTTNGTHTAGTGSNSQPVANRIAMTSLGHFGVGSGVNPLPIELISFDGRRIQDVVRLEWKTASEFNNDFFTPERSADGINFTAIGRVNGAGSSTTVRDYSFTDIKPLTQTSFYRLKQTDFDGRSSYSDIITIKSGPVRNTDKPIQISKIYPSPFTDQFRVIYHCNTDDQVLMISVSGMGGRKVFERQVPVVSGENEFVFDEGHALQKGNYILRIGGRDHSDSRAVIK
jgi:hypothetical protein